MKHYGDVSKINGGEIEPVDVITFGSPCQDMSVAGKREGMKHSEQGDEETTRSGLFYEAIRIIKEMRESTDGEYPKYAVWENVPGAFSSNKGHDFHAVLEALCSVCDSTVSIPKPYDAKRANQLVWSGAGEIVGDSYSIAWRTLDAQYWGVPQRRKRIYLVADFTGRCAGEILFKPDSLRRDMQTGNEAGQGAAADAVGSVDGSVGVECLNPWDSQTIRQYATNGVYPALNSNSGGGMNRQGVVYSFDSLSSNSMKSSNPFSGCRAVEVAKCIDTTYPDPSKNQGGVAVVQPLVLKERAGCEGGGKGALWSDKAFTLATSQDMSVCVLNDQGGSSINVESEEISPTLRANSHQHEPVIAFAQNQRDEVRDLGDKAGALAAEAGVHQQTYVAQPVIALQANCIERADTAGCNGAGWRENESYTLNTIDRHTVRYDARGNGDGVIPINTMTCQGSPSDNGRMGLGVGELDDPANTISAAHCHAVCFDRATFNQGGQGQPCIVENSNPPRKYIIRRLTPTECARLQGFPDTWSNLAPYDPADAEFWEDVRKTHAEINGKKYKPVKDLKKWYDKLHTDSAEYKMWGNGIALPNAEFVLHGIAEQGAKTLGSLFDGSGGFPLAGAMNGIVPIWASEIKPYPIAVTKSRFGGVDL